MILKFLLVATVIAMVYFIFFKKKPAKKVDDPKAKKKDKLQSNDMVACESCGTYSELSETIISSSKYYCSDACVSKA